MKAKDFSCVVEGVKVTLCAYRAPKKGQKTFGIDKGNVRIQKSEFTPVIVPSKFVAPK